jgi:lysophospholipase L1-like esterase
MLAFGLALLLSGCASSGGGSTTLSTSTSRSTSTSEVATTSSLVATTTTAAADFRLVAIGDSIPFNSSNDCSGCTGFVDRYAAAIEAATGKVVEARNLSQHTGLTLPGLLAEMDELSDQLAAADVIVVGIAHNSMELNSAVPCGYSLVDDMPDWSKLDAECAAASAEEYRPQYESLFSQIVAMRDGKPTILRTINRYNDWIGWEAGNLTPEQDQLTKVFIDDWNQMLCAAAEENGFGCADIYTAFNGPDGLTPSGDLLAADYTHPSDKGNELIAGVLTDMGFAPLG